MSNEGSQLVQYLKKFKMYKSLITKPTAQPHINLEI